MKIKVGDIVKVKVDKNFTTLGYVVDINYEKDKRAYLYDVRCDTIYSTLKCWENEMEFVCKKKYVDDLREYFE